MHSPVVQHTALGLALVLQSLTGSSVLGSENSAGKACITSVSMIIQLNYNGQCILMYFVVLSGQFVVCHL